MGIIRNLFGGKDPKRPASQEYTEEQHARYYDAKQEALEHVLGPMQNEMSHSLIPFELGGSLDLYYFPEHLPGVGLASMELLDPGGRGPIPNEFGTYELVAFTKFPYSREGGSNFQWMNSRMCGVLSAIAHYSSQAQLSPGDTCEIPAQDDATNCVLLSLYEPEGRKFRINGSDHHLLLVTEVFKIEMDMARSKGSQYLIDALVQQGYYPYSDLGREPVA